MAQAITADQVKQVLQHAFAVVGEVLEAGNPPESAAPGSPAERKRFLQDLIDDEQRHAELYHLWLHQRKGLALALHGLADARAGAIADRVNGS